MTTVESPPEGGRVLVVDDESALCHAIGRRLENRGFAARCATTAAAARVLLADGPTDVVLCDVSMPGEDGLSLLRHIETDHPEVAVVMVTGVDDERIARAALDHGAYGYLLKPCETTELLIAVVGAMRRRDAERQNEAYRTRLESIVTERTAELAAAVVRLSDVEADLRDAYAETIRRLALAAEFRDPTTGRHIQRMSGYAALLARAAGLEDDDVEAIRMASPLHDIGKVGVPEAILQKPGPLDADEWTIMRRHPALGAELLAGARSPLLQLGATISLGHHERWDGTGYPHGVGAEDIPLAARIVAVADVFDALTTVRPYKPAFPFERARALLLEGRGTHLDPTLVDAFLAAEDEVRAVLDDRGQP